MGALRVGGESEILGGIVGYELVFAGLFEHPLHGLHVFVQGGEAAPGEGVELCLQIYFPNGVQHAVTQGGLEPVVRYIILGMVQGIDLCTVGPEIFVHPL